MIHTTAPMPNQIGASLTGASLAQLLTAPVAGEFAALLQTTQGTDGAGVSPAPKAVDAPAPIALPDLVKDTSDGLAALALQANAVAPRTLGEAHTTMTAQVVQPVAIPVPPEPALAAAVVSPTGAGGPVPATMSTKPPTAAFKPAQADPAPKPAALHGKDGKPGGKMLPSAGEPAVIEQSATSDTTAEAADAKHTRSDEHGTSAAAASAPVFHAPASQADLSVSAPGAAVIAMPAGAVVPDAPPAAFTRVAARPNPAPPVTAQGPAPRQPATASAGIAALPPRPIAAQVGAVRLEPIEILAAEATRPTAPIATAATPQPGEPVMMPAADAARPPLVVGEAVTAVFRPAPASSDAAPVTTAPAMPRNTFAPEPLAPPEPEIPAAKPAPVTQHQPLDTSRPNAGTSPSVQAANKGPKPPESETALARPLDRQPISQPLPFDARPAAAVATPPEAPAATATVATETPQDFETLVSRLAEAREAAAPHVVRTSLAHGEFGRVTMQIGQQDGGLSVTLASPDPEFAGAVQAAAASLAGQSATGGEQPRQDASAQQQGYPRPDQAQAQSGPQTNAGGGQNPRADASGQQARREGGSSPRHEHRQSDTPARNGGGRGEQRSGSGVYA